MKYDSIPTQYTFIERLGQHHEQDWATFSHLYHGLILGMAIRMAPGLGLTLRDHEQKEVLQETLIELLRLFALGRYQRAEGSFRAWLSGVAKNIIKRAREKRLRRERREQSLDAEQSEGGSPRESSIPDPGPRPDQAFEIATKLALVQEALEALVRCKWVEQERVEIYLALVRDGKTPEEVAAAFGKKRNNIDAAKFAVLKKLKRMIHCLEEGIDPSEDRE